MTARFRQALFLAAFILPAARAQFQLFLVNGNVEQAAGPIYAFGNVDTGDTATAQFRIRNTSGAAASLSLLSVSGAGFSLTAPAVPVTLNPQASIDFSASFQAAAAGAYSGSLDSVGISILLTATAVPQLTYQVNAAAGLEVLGAAPVDFGNAAVGSSALLNFTALNQTPQPINVPGITVTGSDFALSGASPAGVLLQPQQSTAFAIVFTPSAAGARSGALTIGTRTYNLTGSAPAPPLPAASLAIQLPQSASGQQGALTVNLDAPAKAAASGTVTMSFQPLAAGAADPAIAFASGGPAASFTVSSGDTQGNFGAPGAAAFQTGTTAGTLVFTMQFGGATSQQTVTLAPAGISVASVQGSRQTAALTVQVTGFDNTRTAGKLVFTFYDASGNAIAPGGIAADSTAAFDAYFAGSGLGGVFGLTAVFPVTGPPAQVSAFDVQLVNAAGTSHTARIGF